MGKTISINSNKSGLMTQNAFLDFIRKERPNVIRKVKSSYPSLRISQIEDIFQDVCISIWEKAQKEEIKLKCPLFMYMYRCCWNKAEHETRHPEREWQLPTDDIMKDSDSDDFEEQTIKQDKVDELFMSIFDDEKERNELLNQVCEVVKDLPKNCDKILYGTYSTPRKKQEVIARECNYKSTSVVKVMLRRCKDKFENRFKAIYESYKKMF